MQPHHDTRAERNVAFISPRRFRRAHLIFHADVRRAMIVMAHYRCAPGEGAPPMKSHRSRQNKFPAPLGATRQAGILSALADVVVGRYFEPPPYLSTPMAAGTDAGRCRARGGRHFDGAADRFTSRPGRAR